MSSLFRKFTTLALLVAFTVLLGCSSPGGSKTVAGGVMDETETMASGKITDSSGNPVAACDIWIRTAPSQVTSALAKVRASFDTTTQNLHFETDSSGSFEIVGLPAGSYVLMAIAPSSSSGRQIHFSLALGDTLNWNEPLQLSPLQSLSIVLDSTWLGDSLHIPELGIATLVTELTLTIPGVPQGNYTLLSKAQSTQTVVVGNSLVASSSSPATSGSSSSTAIAASSASVTGQSSSSPTTASVTITWDAAQTVGSFTDSRDGANYQVSTFGGAVWFTQNLQAQATDATCNPSDTYASTTCQDYGRFYSYSTALSACPAGWHLPTMVEWSSLFLIGGGESMVGSAFKSLTGWTTGNGLNTFGFSVLPAGSAAFPALGTDAYFWTATPDVSGLARMVRFSSGSSGVSNSAITTTNGFSVRCVLN